MATMLEVLSDEIIIQFFEYLDAFQLYRALFNLNSRFNRLLKDHLLNLKFNSKYIRSINAKDVRMWYTMVNHLTAMTLINDRHIRIFMSVFSRNDFMCLRSLTLRRVYLDKQKESVARCITTLKLLKNLRVQAIGPIDILIAGVFYFNALPELQSLECISHGYPTNILFTPSQKTNFESLTVECILHGFSKLLLQTPKLKYLNVTLTNTNPDLSIIIGAPFPSMVNLKHLKMKIHSVSYNYLLEIMKSMPCLESLELSGSSIGQNLDNGHRLKQLFGHLPEVQLDNLKCRTTATSINAILPTFNDDFWSDITCSIKRNKACISAFGYRE